MIAFADLEAQLEGRYDTLDPMKRRTVLASLALVVAAAAIVVAVYLWIVFHQI